MAKSDNMLSLLWLLYARRRMTAAQIAKELEISVRTVYRYIDSLSASGVPIIADSGHDGGYCLAPGFRATPFFFDPLEVSALFHATKFAQTAGYPYSDVLNRVLIKLQRTLAPDQITHLEKHLMGMEVIPYRRGGAVEPWLGILIESVAQSKTVEMWYHKPESEEAEWRRIDPYGLAFSTGVWYLAGYCHTRKAMRTFRVDRIQALQESDQTFSRPGDFSLQDFFSETPITQRAVQSPLQPVRVEGSPWSISALCDHWFFRPYVVESHRTGALLQVPADSGFDEAAFYLAAYGNSIQIQEPDELRAKIAQLCYSWGKHFEQNCPLD